MPFLAATLQRIRDSNQTDGELVRCFEQLATCYFRNEPKFRETYCEIASFAEWSAKRVLDHPGIGMHIVATTFSGETHAIHCKAYAPEHRIDSSDIDCFLAASAHPPFSLRIIVTTTSNWSKRAEASIRNQHPPVVVIDLDELERSVIDWTDFVPGRIPIIRPKKNPRPHQQQAVARVVAGLAVADRGKLIMACGTGKTLTSLRIAETVAGAGKHVLFMVPSLALLSQSLAEWTQESQTPIRCFAVCSDTDVGNKRSLKVEDSVETVEHELAYPATTNAERLAQNAIKIHSPLHMTVVFATYQSIGVLNAAQQEHELPDFDLIICDEAHRTTGARFENEDDSHFVRIHDNQYVRGRKRLYMTATPRIYTDAAKEKAKQENTILCSMDDERLFGKQLSILNFSEAVQRELLVDYKVVVLTIDESHVSRRLEQYFKDSMSDVSVQDAALIIGCWKALSKQGLTERIRGSGKPMQRAVAFCQVIGVRKGAKVHKTASKQIAARFQEVVEAYAATEKFGSTTRRLVCQSDHIDGTMNASEKSRKINWLKALPSENTCRILCNVRCLSEGVDVPALDAVMFLHPRSSQIDVVQSVGRVMRTSEGKTRGYIILPVVHPAGIEPHEALNDNATYKAVWQVLQALRSHDDRFDDMVNKLELGYADPDKLEVISSSSRTHDDPHTPLGGKPHSRNSASEASSKAPGVRECVDRESKGHNEKPPLDSTVIERAILAKIVKKVGNKTHWEEWAIDVGRIARTHIDRITGILENKANSKERKAFANFTTTIRHDISSKVTNAEIIEMLSQHLVTKPVFDALFADHSFTTKNPVSKSMQCILELLGAHHVDRETDTLAPFYESVRSRAGGIPDGPGKQKIILELYERFFKNAFTKMTERLGIVYTPIEIVDFILHSAEHVLRTEFDQTLGDECVTILDPFVGTGTFITRLLQSGLILQEDMKRKYLHEIFANEIVLLAYHIAAVNIESAYHAVTGGDYQPFPGIRLTDTFDANEEDIKRMLLHENTKRRKTRCEKETRVIVGNPPYSARQSSQNDNNENAEYPTLDKRIADTYVARAGNGNKNSVYDSYIRAIRWASDRLGNRGIIGFVTNGGFIEAKAASGLRRCLAEEFNTLFVFHLRGNSRTQGDVRRREGENVFGGGSRAPIAISILVKNPVSKVRGAVYFRDIGDYLTRTQKLSTVAELGSVAGVESNGGWTRILPDVHGDWVSKRDSGYYKFRRLGSNTRDDDTVFGTVSLGVQTNRDAWAYNPSRIHLAANMSKTIAFYNAEVERFNTEFAHVEKSVREAQVRTYVSNDSRFISWDNTLLSGIVNGRTANFDEKCIVRCVYRPFGKQYLYFDSFLNHGVSRMQRLFPRNTCGNLAIMVRRTSGHGQLALLTDSVSESQTLGNTLCFPLYAFELACNYRDPGDMRSNTPYPGRTADSRMQYSRRSGISDWGLRHFQTAYPHETITKEDIFYYVYGVLHSTQFRARYANTLAKDCPRIPRMRTSTNFWAFSNAGRALGELHINYEKVPEYVGVTVEGPKMPTPTHYRVEQMKYGRKQDTTKNKTVIHYNRHLTVHNIPLEAYDYVVGGKPAIEWVMKHQSITTDKASGIVKNANDYAIETMNDPRYPLSLLLRVITVSLETMSIVKSLPSMDILEEEPGIASF